MRKNLFVASIFLASCVTTAVSKEIEIGKGWNLLGTPCNLKVEELKRAGIITVWTWDRDYNYWRGWSPNKTIRDLLLSFGVLPLKNIPAYSGFWVSAKEDTLIYICDKVKTKAVKGDKVFDFYDDFTDCSTLSTKYERTHTFNNVYIYNSQLVLDYTGYYHHYWGIITKKDVALDLNDYKVEYKAKTQANDAPKVAIWAKGSVNNPYWRVQDTYPFLALIYDDSYALTWTPADISEKYIDGYFYKAWRLFRYHIHRDDSSGTNGYIEYLFYGDYGTNDNKIKTPFKKDAKVLSVNKQYYGNKIFIGGENNGDIYFDWIRVRKYADQKPIVSINGNTITIFNLNTYDLNDFQVRIPITQQIYDLKDSSGNSLPFCYEHSNGECDNKIEDIKAIWVKVPNIPAQSSVKLILEK